MLSPTTMGLLIGGLMPALFFGVSGIFTKGSTNGGVGPGMYLIIFSVPVLIAGIVVHLLWPTAMPAARPALWAFLAGALWSVGSAGIALALGHYGVPLGKIIPIFNMNTLIGVVLALWIFGEWKQVNVTTLIAGAFLIVVGGVLVARA